MTNDDQTKVVGFLKTQSYFLILYFFMLTTG
jgi:hypothetical protein